MDHIDIKDLDIQMSAINCELSFLLGRYGGTPDMTGFSREELTLYSQALGNLTDLMVEFILS